MTTHQFKTLNRTLRLAILDSGKTQRTVAALTSIDETRLSRIVRGRVRPFPSEKKELARVLRRAARDLFATVSA